MFRKKHLINQYVEDVTKYVEVKLSEYEEKQKSKPKFSSVLPPQDDTPEVHFSMETPPDAFIDNAKKKEESKPKDVRYSHRDPDAGKYWFSDKMIGSLSDKITASAKSTFVDCLLLYIKVNHLKDSAVYKAAGIDRRLYSKMISDRNYKPSKDTCIALCFALMMNEYEFKDMLAKAGYTLSDSIKRDLVIEYFLKNKIYDVYCINGVLEKMGFKPLN